MYKRKIKYTDYNGTEREEDFYFNLTQSEVIEMEAEADGGLAEKLMSIVHAKDGAVIMKVLKNFILKSYGEKSSDGRYFDKSEEISRKFEHSEAYNVFFMEMCTNADAAAQFIQHVLPFNDDQRKELAVKVSEIQDSIK